MLDLELIVNVVVGIFVYKSIGIILECALLRILAMLVSCRKGLTKIAIKKKNEEFLKRNSN